jgi:2,3-bisphosphoglycerate-independent phosphoglycerate mutase
MSAHEVTDNLVNAIDSGKHDIIICNYAPTRIWSDIPGNSMPPSWQSRSSIPALGAWSLPGEMLIIADHGDAELMLNDETDQVHTAHKTYPVPLINVGRPAQMAERGSLCDIVPSMLYLMNLEVPPEMSGTPLVALLSGSGCVEEQANAPAKLHG